MKLGLECGPHSYTFVSFPQCLCSQTDNAKERKDHQTTWHSGDHDEQETADDKYRVTSSFQKLLCGCVLRLKMLMPIDSVMSLTGSV